MIVKTKMTYPKAYGFVRQMPVAALARRLAGHDVTFDGRAALVDGERIDVSEVDFVGAVVLILVQLEQIELVAPGDA